MCIRDRFYLAPYPHEIQIALAKETTVKGLKYTPRQDSSEGRIGKYEVYISHDGKEWGKALASGTFADSKEVQTVEFNPCKARYVKLQALSAVSKEAKMAAVAELEAGSYTHLEWSNEQVSGVNKEEAVQIAIPFTDEQQAMNLTIEESPYYKTLNGIWKFHWVADPKDRPQDFCKPEYDVSQWDNIKAVSYTHLMPYTRTGSDRRVSIRIACPPAWQEW